MSKPILISLLFGMLALVAAGCTPTAAPPAPAGPAPAIAKQDSRTGWEQRWEGLVAAARKEGRVSVYGGWGPEVRTTLTQAFGKKFGIDLEFTPFARGAEMVARVQQERAAGLRVVDVYGQGGGTLMTGLKPVGLLGPLEPVLVLPEVVDPAAWTIGKFPWYDQDKLAIGMLSSAMRPVFYNSTLVREGEITSARDLLKPQYKGKIVVNDPAFAGIGNAMFSHLVHFAWNEAEASDFLRRLIKEQEAVIMRDNRLAVEWVARGKSTVGFGADAEYIMPFIRAGAPIVVPATAEGIQASSVGGSLAVAPTPPHPNGAVVFINWLLSREGQTVFTESWGTASLRSDVTSSSANPMFLPRPGERVILATEEITLMKEKDRELAKKIMDEAAN
ncbi:MAG: ABC transporter substrate-binding protein [Chloroflexi bacterium]|nr:ABC transporter substrate-binding protein [Chloroflexota bacterium]